MNQLKDLYDKFETITKSYCGEKTDWKEKYEQLEKLYQEAQKIQISQSKNSKFYNYIKSSLIADINNERIRIFKKTF